MNIEIYDFLGAKADRYARATTCTRCSRMGECEGCTFRFCDYKSRVEAFKEGYKSCCNTLLTTDAGREDILTHTSASTH